MKHHLRGEMASRRVWLDGIELKPGPSQRVWNHSPDGFNWGYGGSGPAQLALAVCLAVTRDRAIAWICYQAFKRDVIAIVPQEDLDIWFEWDLTRQPMWMFLGRRCVTEIPTAPAIGAMPENSATQERQEQSAQVPPWCRVAGIHCGETDCTKCTTCMTEQRPPFDPDRELFPW